MQIFRCINTSKTQAKTLADYTFIQYYYYDYDFVFLQSINGRQNEQFNRRYL